MRRTGIYHCRVKPGLCPGVPGASPGVVGHKRAAKGVLITTSRLGGADPGFRLLDAMLPSRPSAVGGLPTGHWSSVFRAEERAADAGRSRSWPSTKPGRRSGPGLFPGLPRTEPGMQPHHGAGDLGCRPRARDPSRSHRQRAAREKPVYVSAGQSPGRPRPPDRGRGRPTTAVRRTCTPLPSGESPVPRDPRQDSEREGASRPFLP